MCPHLSTSASLRGPRALKTQAPRKEKVRISTSFSPPSLHSGKGGPERVRIRGPDGPPGSTCGTRDALHLNRNLNSSSRGSPFLPLPLSHSTRLSLTAPASNGPVQPQFGFGSSSGQLNSTRFDPVRREEHHGSMQCNIAPLDATQSTCISLHSKPPPYPDP